MSIRSWVVVSLVLVFAVGTVVRIYPIPTRSISHPEMYTPGIRMPEGLSQPRQRLTLRSVLTGTFTSDTHPPGFYVLMLFWTKLFGAGIWSLRLPAVMFGLGSIALVIWLGQLIGHRAAGWVAAVLMAASGYHAFWSSISRMFSLACFLGLLSTILLMHLTREKESNRLRMAAYAAITFLGLASHVFYWPLFLTQMLWALWKALRSSDRMTRVCGLQILILTLASPLLAAAAYQSDNGVAILSGDALRMGREYLSFSFLFPLDTVTAMAPPLLSPLVLTPLQEALLLAGRIAALVIATVSFVVGLRSVKQEEGSQESAPLGPAYRYWLAAAAVFAAGAIMGFVYFARVYLKSPNESLRITEVMSVLPFVMAAVGMRLKSLWPRLSTWCRGLGWGGWMEGNLAFVYLLAVVPIALLSIFSIRRPILNARGLLLLTPYLLLCLAVGLVAVARGRRLVQAILVAALGALHAASLMLYVPRTGSPVDYRRLAQELIPQVRQSDFILIRRHWRDTPMLYYLSADRFHLVELSQAQAVFTRPEINRVWVVAFAPSPFPGMAEPTLGDFRQEEVVQDYNGRVILYARRK
jgi:4-amino-4-deoxy-L-arabinose transferase-like glycosyltransferase